MKFKKQLRLLSFLLIFLFYFQLTKVSALEITAPSSDLYDLNMKKLYPSEIEKLFKNAVSYHNSRNFKKAISLYDCLLKYNINEKLRNTIIVYRNAAESKNIIMADYEYKDSYKPFVKDGLNYYHQNNIKFTDNIKYEALGDYLNYASKNFRASDRLMYDSKGIPKIKYGNEFHFNPVTVSQYALHLYSRYKRGEKGTKSGFINCADFLVDSTSEDGSLKYSFPHNHRNMLNVGWTSAMAQGQALSVLSRAYVCTGDLKYVESGIKIFNYLITPVSKGGVMDTLEALDNNFKDFIFYQEYVNTIPSYTLNGFIFTLLGIYDWLELSKQVDSIDYETVNYYFNEGIKTLKAILPYYDYGGFSSYDLYHLTAGTNPIHSNYYHAVHIELLQAIYYITSDEYFINIREQWIQYIKKEEKASN